MQNKVVLITGCSSGIGFELVKALLLRNYHVIASMRNATDRASLFQNEQKQFPNSLTLLSLDVTQASEREAASQLIQEKFGGRLDALVNNAGYGVFGALEEASDEQIREQMEVNVLGLILLTKKLLPALRQARGRLIHLSSVLGFTGLPLTSLYCTSKFAVEGFGEVLSHELSPFGIQVCLVEPGGHRTKFGDNVKWSHDRLNPSPYERAIKNYQAMLNNKLGSDGVPADNVVQTIVQLLEKKRMPLRVRCGLDAKGTYLLKRLLPERLFIALARTGTRLVYYQP